MSAVPNITNRSRSRRLRIPTIAGALAIAIAGTGSSFGSTQIAQAHTTYPYTLTIIPTFGGDNSAAMGVNDSGEVTGGAATRNDNGVDVFTWQAGHMTDLGRIGGRIASAGAAINDSGDIAGTGDGLQSYLSTAGVWRPGHGWTTFSHGLCASGANSINNSGVVGGFTCHQQGSTDQSRAALWRPSPQGDGYKQLLLSATDWSSSVSQVADTGDAVGLQTDDNFVAHAMYWARGSRTLHLPSLVGPNSIAWGLTASPSPAGPTLLAVGGADSSAMVENACYWPFQMSPDRRYVKHATARCQPAGSIPNYPTSELLAVNAGGEAVGDASTPDDGHAVVWTARTGLVDLNSLVAPTTLELVQANSVSSTGYIAGFGMLPNGDQRGFLLTPATQSSGGTQRAGQGPEVTSGSEPEPSANAKRIDENLSQLCTSRQSPVGLPHMLRQGAQPNYPYSRQMSARCLLLPHPGSRAAAALLTQSTVRAQVQALAPNTLSPRRSQPGGSSAGGVVRQAPGPAWHLSRMLQPRTGQTATLLSDNRVLIAGGLVPGPSSGDATITAETYATASSRWQAAPAMDTSRDGQFAVGLRNGSVLVGGGFDDSFNLTSSVQIYDPRTNAWLPAAPLPAPAALQAAVLLQDGEVLVVGGDVGGLKQSRLAWLFNPNTNRWRAAASMRYPRVGHGAVELKRGTVLVAGGSTPWAEMYHPSSNTWTLAGRSGIRFLGAMLPLGQNGALMAGGFSAAV